MIADGWLRELAAKRRDSKRALSLSWVSARLHKHILPGLCVYIRIYIERLSFDLNASGRCRSVYLLCLRRSWLAAQSQSSAKFGKEATSNSTKLAKCQQKVVFCRPQGANAARRVQKLVCLVAEMRPSVNDACTGNYQIVKMRHSTSWECYTNCLPIFILQKSPH